MFAAQGGSTPNGKLYVDDVFSTYLYTGNGSTQTINNGIDLAGKGGMVWIKSRTSTTNNYTFDTNRGANNILYTNSSTGNSGTSGNSFLSNGFSTTGASLETNVSSTDYASWTFRKAPKFFDVVTYTGNGVAGRQIPHALGVAPGFITTKSTSTTGDWNSYHRSATGDLQLNLTTAQSASRAIITAADASSFAVSGVANTNGATYVAYLFAHDPSADGIIQCGSYSGSASVQSINLGFEPQAVLIKRTDSTSVWYMFDNMRGMTQIGSNSHPLFPNQSSAEDTNQQIGVTSTGFSVNGGSGLSTAGGTYIYLAIRRPNKPPTTGTEVFQTAVGTANVGFITSLLYADFQFDHTVAGTSNWDTGSRLAGMKAMFTNLTDAETSSPLSWDRQNGLNWNNAAASSYRSWQLRRAPGFFDVVCYTGTGVAHLEPHNLGSVPEMMIVKERANTGLEPWIVYHAALGPTKLLVLNSNNAEMTGVPQWNSTAPTSAGFSLTAGQSVNDSGATYVAYLFATRPGVSKVGSYTGNGTSQTINCGFTTGARFILIKRTDSTGDWFTWDSARGISSANDPHLSLNTTAAEVTTDDSVDPDASGFIVNQNAATNINVSGGSYIFLAIS